MSSTLIWSARTHVPRFLGPIDRCGTRESSPFQMVWSDFRQAYAAPGRRVALIEELERFLEVLRPMVVVETLLIGGSFLDGRVKVPKDIDCGLFYRAAEDAGGPAGDLAARLSGAMLDARPRGIDARLAPVDAGADLIIRMSAFLANLYLAERPTAVGAGRGLLQVSMTQGA